MTTESTAIAARPKDGSDQTELALRKSGDVANLSTVAASANALSVIKETGDWFHRSGMFGCKTPAQGCVLALECYITGQRPSKIANENMIAFDRIVRKYEMLLADLVQAGGDYVWIDTGEDLETATIQITWRGRTNVYSYTMEKAARAGVVKKDSAWEKRPENMLRSKAVRQAMQMFAPEILKGAITPEDAEEIAMEPGAVAAAAPPKPTPAERKKRAAELQAMNGATASNGATGHVVDSVVIEQTVEASVATEATADPEVIDAESTPADSSATEEPPFETPTNGAATAPAKASDSQLRKLVDLMNPSKLNIPWPKYIAGLQKEFGIDKPNDMTPDQANSIIKRFEDALAKKRPGATTSNTTTA